MWVHGVTGVFKEKFGYDVTGESYHEENVEVSYVWAVETDKEFIVNKIKSDINDTSFEESLKEFIFQEKNKDRLKHLLSDNPFS